MSPRPGRRQFESNPKALIFYISFLPQFIDNQKPFAHQIIVLGGIYILVVFFVMPFYAFLGDYVVSIFKDQLILKLFGRTISIAFILTGLSLFKLEKNYTDQLPGIVVFQKTL